MAVIDTLKLARALRDKGGFTQEAAEATAEALNSALGAEVATKRDIAEVEQRLSARIAELDQRLSAQLTFLQWQIGLAIAGEIVIGLPALWLLLRVAAKVGALG